MSSSSSLSTLVSNNFKRGQTFRIYLIVILMSSWSQGSVYIGFIVLKKNTGGWVSGWLVVKTKYRDNLQLNSWMRWIDLDGRWSWVGVEMELGVELELDNNTVRDKGIYIYIFYKTPNKIVVFCTFKSIKKRKLQNKLRLVKNHAQSIVKKIDS